jgi:hypothetical protein
MAFMSRLRRHLGRFVALWLICQTASLLAAPLSLAHMSVQAAMDSDDCNCPDVGPGQFCPMHHKQRPGKQTCRICSSSDGADLALVVLTVGLGILSPTPGPVVVPRSSASIAATAVSVVARAERPESPPPRS